MNKPFVRDNAIFIPANDCGFLLPEYRDTVRVAGESLTTAWGYPYRGGSYRHNATDNPEADLAAVLAVWERNTAPKPKVPYVKDRFLHIPADENGLIHLEYRSDEYVIGERLADFWGSLQPKTRTRARRTYNPEQDLAKVMEVYERNTNKDVAITITKLPPEPHPESGTDIPVPMCRVELGVSIPRAEDFTRDRAVPFLVLFCEDVTPKRWNPDTVRRQVFAADTMSAALALAEAKAKDIRITVRDYLARVAVYDEKRADAIAAADKEYERRANS